MLLKPIFFTEEMLRLGWSPGPLYHEYFCCVMVLANASFSDPHGEIYPRMLCARMDIIIFSLSAKRWIQNYQYFLQGAKMLITLSKKLFSFNNSL
jgi:hypothetical protein